MLRDLEKFETGITGRLEAMLAVALIAVARKIIVLEPKELQEGTLLGIAALVLALTVGYYLVRRERRENGSPDAQAKR